ncbi:heat shock protein HSP 90-alpha [Reticulomyxa filosa]|uniref:Heat shock protein HSP 90-alpha n=1 Tax=Reticulomyxa filosa TaxID=46433 RepID=X6LN17_RETFI|nr:heat shock protein HSP 90-alpha [Reticulomyxa filosa]|eukprot:ETO02771.1 heat shock protein HSP 90-alpha [Reticulomyxa filosa]
MTKEDLVNNIVIIARSGTKKCIEIVQFDVGFYSAYLVSKRVVRSKQSKISKSESEYEQHEKTVKKHSQFVFPINLLTIKEEKVLRWCLIFFGYTYIRGGKCCYFFLRKKKKLELLFVPKKAPFQQTMKEKNIKLFVPRVFIMDDCKDLCIEYLPFIRCVADSEDLPLNLNSKNHNKLADFLIYHSTKSSEELKSLKEYVSGTKENQKNIDYITGESRSNVEESQFLESKIDFDVLFLVNYIDGSAVQQLREYDLNKFVCVTKVCLGLPLTEEEKKQQDEKMAYESLTKKMKEIMWDNVEKVIASFRMIDSSCYLATVEYRWPDDTKRIMKALSIGELSLEDRVKFASRVNKLIKLCISAFLMLKMINRTKKPQKKFQKNKQLTNQTLQHKIMNWKRETYNKLKKLLIFVVVSGNKEIVNLLYFSTSCFFIFILNLIFLKYNFQHIQQVSSKHYHKVANYVLKILFFYQEICTLYFVNHENDIKFLLKKVQNKSIFISLCVRKNCNFNKKMWRAK